jgi:electron transport complex protein RnfA
MSILGSLGIISGLSLNLIIQFGLGIQCIVLDGEEKKRVYELPLVQGGILFLSLPILWAFFTCILVPLSLGFFEYMLLFPLSVLVCMGLEAAVKHLFPKAKLALPVLPETKLFDPLSAYNGLVPAALLMSLNMASSLIDAAVLALGFYGGLLLAILILREIQKRASLEAVPEFLRGLPLMLISMGLLSLIFSATGIIFIKYFGV